MAYTRRIAWAWTYGYLNRGPAIQADRTDDELPIDDHCQYFTDRVERCRLLAIGVTIEKMPISGTAWKLAQFHRLTKKLPLIVDYMRLWKTEYSSFMKMAQPVYCNQLIVVPLSVFHRMAETIGNPKAQLIIIFNTARCGSTLLTQIFEYTGRCVTVSEPDSMTLVATKYRIDGNTPEVRQLARDVIRWECRPYPSMQPPPLAYVVKLSAPEAVALELFMDLYPSSRNLFMYRDVVKVAQSLYRMSYTLPTVWLAFKLGRLSSAVMMEVAKSVGLDGRDFRYRLSNDLHLGVILACIAMKSYVDLRHSGRTEVAGVRYEDLVDNRTESLQRIIEFCHLPEELVQPGLRGFEIDSQRNSVIAKSTIGGIREPKLTAEAKEVANDLLRKNGLPLIGEECLLEGTITHRKRTASKQL